MGSKRSWRGEMDEGGIGLNHVKNLKILSSLLSLSSRSTCIPIPHFQISLFDSIFRVLTFPSNTGRLWWREWCGFFLPKIRIWMSIFFCSFSILHTLNMRMIGDSWTPLLVASPSCVQRCMQKGTQGSRNVRKMRKSYKVIGSECDQFNSALNEYGIRKPETSNWVLRTPPLQAFTERPRQLPSLWHPKIQPNLYVDAIAAGHGARLWDHVNRVVD